MKRHSQLIDDVPGGQMPCSSEMAFLIPSCLREASSLYRAKTLFSKIWIDYVSRTDNASFLPPAMFKFRGSFWMLVRRGSTSKRDLLTGVLLTPELSVQSSLGFDISLIRSDRLSARSGAQSSRALLHARTRRAILLLGHLHLGELSTETAAEAIRLYLSDFSRADSTFG